MKGNEMSKKLTCFNCKNYMDPPQCYITLCPIDPVASVEGCPNFKEKEKMRYNVRDAKGRFCKAPKTIKLEVNGSFAESVNNTIYRETVARAISKVLNNGLLDAINVKFEEGYEVVAISHQSLYDKIIKSLIMSELSFVKERYPKKLRKLYIESIPKVMLNYGLLAEVNAHMLQVVKMLE